MALILSLFMMGALYAAIAPAAKSSADGSTPSQVARGKALFDVSCATCHGMNGVGTSDAPTLVGVGAAAVDFQMGTGRMPLAHPGAQGPRGRTNFSAQDISDISAYVASLGSGPDVPTDAQLDTKNLTAEQIARGGELFRTNCSACHNYEGGGGAMPNGGYAPSLTKTSNAHIYEAVRTGPSRMPTFSKGTLTDTDVREIIGYLQTLREQPNNGGFSLAGVGPVSEGFWGWVVGIGGLVLVAMWLAKRGARAR